MNKVDPTMIGSFRKDFEAAIAAIEKKYNINVDLGRGTYNDTMFSIKMTCTVKDASGQAIVDPHKDALARMVLSSRFIPTDESNAKVIGHKITYGPHGDPGVIIDYDSKKHKYPFIVDSPLRGQLKMSVNSIMSIEGFAVR